MSLDLFYRPMLLLTMRRPDDHPGPENLSRYFASGGAARGVITAVLESARVVRIATAYFEPSGYQCLREALRGKEVRLLLGRPEAGDDKIERVVDDFFKALVSANYEERTSAMEEMRDALRAGKFLVGLSGGDDLPPTTFAPRYLYQHAKLYIADTRAAVVCSSNFTWSGLVDSREAGYVVNSADDVRYFVERFDLYYRKALPVAEELLERLEEWLKIHSPFEIYMRALLELYGLTRDEEGGKLPELAGYQRPVVARLMRSLEEHGGCMLVASTGLGKTIMAAHAVARLRKTGAVDSAIILCPAGLKSMWARAMRAARVSSEEFSYYILSVEDWKQYRFIGLLEHELRGADSKTIIIMDESHHMRNPEEAGSELRLRHRRIIDSVSREARILLMTATPYSRGVEDINAQLMLLPPKSESPALFGASREHWAVENPAALSDLQNSIVLTAPSVVRDYSIRDLHGERFVLFSGDNRRYFPRRIHLKNVNYENPCDGMLLDLLQSGLLYKKTGTEADGPTLFGPGPGGERDPLLEARIVHQFCSSLREIDTLLGKMEVREGFKSLRFHNHEELSRRVREMRCDIFPLLDDTARECPDEKIRVTVEILKSFPDKKAVIFCHYRETSRYIAECLPRYLKGIAVETTVDKRVDEIETIVQRFAPVANNIELGEENAGQAPEGGEIQVLVATGAMSEGFNFQDAPVLINFDLPWTVLVLAQRMGRILRPWKDPREIYIFNLIPSTMENGRIHHALNWKERLQAKDSEHRAFSEIPTIVDQGSEFEMLELAQSIRRAGDVDLDLDDALLFIENAGELKTTLFIDDLARLTEEEIARLRSLSGDIKSHKYADVEEPCLFLLFEFASRYYPAIFNRRGDIRLDSDMMDRIMGIIRSDPAEQPAAALTGPDEFDTWVEMSRNSWARSRKIVSNDIHIMCRMTLMPMT